MNSQRREAGGDRRTTGHHFGRPSFDSWRPTMLTGGCFCGHVRYEAGGVPFNPTVCHCSMR
jgi:hypothetical protein